MLCLCAYAFAVPQAIAAVRGSMDDTMGYARQLEPTLAAHAQRLVERLRRRPARRVGGGDRVSTRASYEPPQVGELPPVTQPLGGSERSQVEAAVL